MQQNWLIMLTVYRMDDFTSMATHSGATALSKSFTLARIIKFLILGTYECFSKYDKSKYTS